MAKEQLRQYDIRYDRDEQDVRYIATQLETHLKERFNVLISTAEYGIEDGHLARRGRNEPFINSIKRGRDTIQRLSPNPVDYDRENAEVAGFELVIDPFLSAPETSLGSKILSISPKGDEGSKYQHNYYDIFTLKRKNGERYVELSRYSSALTTQEYARRLPGFSPENPPTAAQLLANPIPITDIFISPEQIHQALHKDHNYMTPSDFEEIWIDVQPAVENYLLNRDARSFNAVLNFADEVWENKKKRKSGQEYKDYAGYVLSTEEINYWGIQEVRQVSTCCPGKSGADIESTPYSVSEFGEKRTLSCTCPFCGEKVVAVIENETITCPKCEKSAPWKENSLAA